MATPKERVLLVCPDARLDHSEYMMSAGLPCYFIRHGYQGAFLHWKVFRSPKAAWKAANERLSRASLATITAEYEAHMMAFSAGKVAA